jgi:hypothetical protein
MPLFKRELLEKVLQGKKTQTRRIHQQHLRVDHVYGVRCRRFDRSAAHIRILRVREEQLGNITLEDAKKEGFKSLEEFRGAWTEINGAWNPAQKVTVYDFQLQDL